jgi:hypothetical protein
MDIVVTIPDEVTAKAQSGANGASVRSLLEYIGVALYKADAITSPQLQELLGIDRFQLDGVLKAHGVFFDYSPEEIEEELATIQKLQDERRAAQ